MRFPGNFPSHHRCRIAYQRQNFGKITSGGKSPPFDNPIKIPPEEISHCNCLFPFPLIDIIIIRWMIFPVAYGSWGPISGSSCCRMPKIFCRNAKLSFVIGFRKFQLGGLEVGIFSSETRQWEFRGNFRLFLLLFAAAFSGVQIETSFSFSKNIFFPHCVSVAFLLFHHNEGTISSASCCWTPTKFPGHMKWSTVVIFRKFEGGNFFGGELWIFLFGALNLSCALGALYPGFCRMWDWNFPELDSEVCSATWSSLKRDTCLVGAAKWSLAVIFRKFEVSNSFGSRVANFLIWTRLKITIRDEEKLEWNFPEVDSKV